MGAERHVKLFRNGRNQAVRIPREFELPGEDAVMRKDGDTLIIAPAKKKTIAQVLDELAERSRAESLPDIDDPPPEPVTDFDWADD